MNKVLEQIRYSLQNEDSVCGVNILLHISLRACIVTTKEI